MVKTMASSLLLLAFLTVPIMATGPIRRAVPVAQNLESRAKYGGGWPLGLDATGESCPTIAPVACGTGLSGSMHQMCCPKDQICKTDGFFVAWCCPTDADCKNYIENFSSCSNTSWIMYQAMNEAIFCCEPDKIAVSSSAGGVYNGMCVDKDQPVSQSVLATSLAQATGAATLVDPTNTPSSQPSSTPTSEGTSLTNTSSGISPSGTDGGSLTSGNPSPAPTSGDSSGSNTPPENSNKSTNKSSSLGIGPIIGLVIGVLGLIILAGIFWLLWRRRTPKPDPHQYTPAPPHPPVPELSQNFVSGIQRKPAPHVMATSMYSSAEPQRAPSSVSQPPRYDPTQRYDTSPAPGQQRYDSPPPVSPSNHPYDSYAEMDGRHGVPPVELRADRTGN